MTGILAGCGTAAAPGTSAGGGAGTPGRAAPAKVSLSVTTISATRSKTRHWTLTCDPTGGTAPDSAAACKAVLSLKNPFKKLGKPTMCPMIMVSGAQIRVSGSWFGQHVNRVIEDGGCTLGVFNSLKKTFY